MDMGQLREPRLKAVVSSRLFGSGSPLMHLLNKHSLLKVSLIRLMHCISTESAPAGMWMFSL